MINIKETLKKAHTQLFNLLRQSSDNEIIAGGLVVLYAITAVIQSIYPEKHHDDDPDSSAAKAQMWATLGSAVVSFGALVIKKCSNKSWGKYLAGRLFNLLVQGGTCVGAVFTAQGMTNNEAADATYIGAIINMLTTLGALISLCDTLKIKSAILPVVNGAVTRQMEGEEFSRVAAQLPPEQREALKQQMRTNEYYGRNSVDSGIYLNPRGANPPQLLAAWSNVAHSIPGRVLRVSPTVAASASSTSTQVDNGAGIGFPLSTNEDKSRFPMSRSA